MIVPLLHVWEGLDSNFGTDTSYHDGVMVFLSYSIQVLGYNLKIGCYLFVMFSSSLFIASAMLYNLDALGKSLLRNVVID
jgi:hypothetical protein